MPAIIVTHNEGCMCMSACMSSCMRGVEGGGGGSWPSLRRVVSGSAPLKFRHYGPPRRSSTKHLCRSADGLDVTTRLRALQNRVYLGQQFAYLVTAVTRAVDSLWSRSANRRQHHRDVAAQSPTHSGLSLGHGGCLLSTPSNTVRVPRFQCAWTGWRAVWGGNGCGRHYGTNWAVGFEIMWTSQRI